MARRALITGITGQDGSYLCELLLAKGYEVHGLIRRSSSFNTARIEPFYKDPHLQDTRMLLHYGDLTDGTSLSCLVKEIMPDEVYNLAAQSHVRVSFDMPVYSVQVGAVGTLQLLEACVQQATAPSFTRLLVARCTAKWRRRRKPRRPLSIPAALTLAPRCSAIGKR